jgi:succinate dehydrogenase/fumarate reductase flavoprotein subunit
MRKDVIVIGGGCAGIIAALEAEKNGANVKLIGRGAIGIGTNSALSNGIFAGPTPQTTPEDYIRKTFQAGKGLNRESMVNLVTREAPQAFSLLRSWGFELEEITGRYIVKPSRPDVIPGLTLMRVLAAKIRESNGIEVVRDFYITEILKNEESIYGVKGFDKTGEESIIEASAIVLATGGAGAIYLRNDNQKGILGQGYYLAAKAGLELWDMEFVQFFPLVIAELGLPSRAVFSPHPKGTRVINDEGEDILQKYEIGDLNEAIKTKRDHLSVALFKEGSKGLVYIDYRKVPSSAWERHPLVLLKRIHFDFKSKPLSVSPAAHFFMGGVQINEEGRTSLPGLFACGEVVWGLHGANRMAGNALTETVVFGRIAGQNAAHHALTHRAPTSNPKGLLKDFSSPIVSSKETLPHIRKQIKEAAWNYAGVVRSEKGMREGLFKLKELERELKGVVPKNISDKKLKDDLMGAAFVLKAVLTASLSREESRGAFIREDFPQQDDLKWRKNSSLVYDIQEDNFSLNHYAHNEERLS